MHEHAIETDGANAKGSLEAALHWDLGTAYDFLLSTVTLMRPKAHGLSAPWAAGVRKRLSPQSQADFKGFFGPVFGLYCYTPLHLVYEMTGPKDVKHFLDFMEAIPGRDFTRRLHAPQPYDPAVAVFLKKMDVGASVSEEEIEEFRKAIARTRILPPPTAAEVHTLVEEMQNPEVTKRRWMSVMREYQAAFFAQEEERMAPILKRVLDSAQKLAKKNNVVDLIEKLSNGYTISQESDIDKLVLVPSIWAHPFVVSITPHPRELVLMWGTRPSGYRLVPGEMVPDQALLVLRALSDPTRLRLLRLLTVEPRTPQALARELKLTLPTVSHHMRELRLAGLVRMETRLDDRARENRYNVRWQSAEHAFEELGRFVSAYADTDNG